MALIATLVALWVLARRVRQEMGAIHTELRVATELRPAFVDLTRAAQVVASSAASLRDRGGRAPDGSQETLAP